MKFTTQKEELLKYLNIVSRLASTRSTLPILQNIYLVVNGNNLLIRSTDLEQTLEVNINGEGESSGAVTIPARLLTEYLQNNTDKIVTISNDDLIIKINSANHDATLRGMAAEDYPTLPEVAYDFTTTMSSVVLSDAINKTVFSSASDETRPILTGLLFKIEGNNLTIVGTDGYRLAKSVITIKQGKDSQFIIPKRSLQELLRILPLNEEVTLSLAQNQCCAQVGDTKLITRVIEGNFPAFESIIPKKHSLEVAINSQVLLQSLKLASLFSRDSAFSTNLEIKGDNLIITATSPVLGDNSNKITLAKKSDTDFKISVNAQYLIDILSVLSGDVLLQFIDQKSPVVVRAHLDERYLYLVMPLRGE
ncbi:DNA polymerase III subunit beta [Candidatus Berkelbacteria bacterium]|nr:DNA polymerase III subunit beta [Candidatus Berkelbacteria bacterium]